MTKKTFGQFIIIGFLIYIMFLICNYDVYYHTQNKFYGEIVLFTFMVIYLLYSLIPLWLKMTLKRVNKLGDDERLYYDIVLSSDRKYVKHIYVSTVLGFYKYELDYPFTIEQNCSYEKAKFFTEKYNNGKMLKNFMNNRATEEKRQNYKESDKTDFWSLFVVKVFFIVMVLIFYIVFELHSPHSNYYF